LFPFPSLFLFPCGSVGLSLEGLRTVIITLRPDSICYVSKFGLGLCFKNYVSVQKGSGCWDLWQCCGVVWFHFGLPQHCQVICFGYYVEPSSFYCQRILLWNELQFWVYFFGMLCVIISNLLYKCKYVYIFHLLVINMLSSFGWYELVCWYYNVRTILSHCFCEISKEWDSRVVILLYYILYIYILYIYTYYTLYNYNEYITKSCYLDFILISLCSFNSQC
jgi:hypothetical protein